MPPTTPRSTDVRRLHLRPAPPSRRRPDGANLPPAAPGRARQVTKRRPGPKHPVTPRRPGSSHRRPGPGHRRSRIRSVPLICRAPFALVGDQPAEDRLASDPQESLDSRAGRSERGVGQVALVIEYATFVDIEGPSERAPGERPRTHPEVGHPGRPTRPRADPRAATGAPAPRCPARIGCAVRRPAPSVSAVSSPSPEHPGPTGGSPGPSDRRWRRSSVWRRTGRQR